MYNQSYEEYIRNILGYPTNYINRSECDTYYEPVNYRNNVELESCYPEIYKIVYPMVIKACRENTQPISKELVDKLTDEIYFAIETDNNINININLKNANINNRMSKETQTEEKENRNTEDRSIENRQRGPNNRTLNDLIRILILRELIGRPQNPPFSRPQPPRPDFPGMMPPPNRPPFMPRDYM